MADKFYLLWSQDDRYVKQFQTDYLANKLKVRPIVFKDKGHFSRGSNPPVLKFPELLKIIKQEYNLS